MPDSPSPHSRAKLDPGDADELRQLNRSPHPYHHQHSDLPYPSEHVGLRNDDTPANADSPTAGGAASKTEYPFFTKESTPGSGSGTDADDEHFLKGLPAPKAKLHKGIRGQNELISGHTTPLPSPMVFGETDILAAEEKQSLSIEDPNKRRVERRSRLHKTIVRRISEVCLLGVLSYMVVNNSEVKPVVHKWGKDLWRIVFLCVALTISYPARVVAWAYRSGRACSLIPLRIPSSFDPAPLLYPPAITILVSLLIAPHYADNILPNFTLALSSLPQQLLPRVSHDGPIDVSHWLLTCLPLVWRHSEMLLEPSSPDRAMQEQLVLLYPLHRTLCAVLYYLTTTSLLTAELQLLSIALLNVLLLAKSPQVQILKALLWVGGLSVLLFCSSVIRWGITLARVPKWRLQRAVPPQKRSIWKTVLKTLSLRRLKYEILNQQNADYATEDFSSSEDGITPVMRVQTLDSAQSKGTADISQIISTRDDSTLSRRHTLSSLEKISQKNRTHTPSGRRKRATSISLRPYLRLTSQQATIRKWLFAAYVYAALGAIIIFGVRHFIQHFALGGREPIGWALGYFFGELSWFRFQVVSANLDWWVSLPPRGDPDTKTCHLGWVQHIRYDDFGEANTRLLLCAYWVGIVALGLVVVFQLKKTYEVDTRRKVFHFMTVGMFLPTVFVDPTFAALALSIVLAVFLIIDLIRASQLPPLSKPIASFLAPYVDGRDFRGPVVISHIFLLIGCAIPLWLALAALPRSGTDNLTGWEVPTRDVSMIAGVVCVGLGDAAASLIGRRWGRRKWIWGGGKSLEGSAAFAVAVFLGLFPVGLWLRVGGWPVSGGGVTLLASARNSMVCGSLASLTEAVLTGGNDNVVVPVVLWTCVKSLGV